MIIDATNTRLGRMATRVAKLALEYENISIINCSKAYIVGKKKNIVKEYTHRLDLGSKPSKGPFTAKRPDKFVRKAIKGMLPSNARGKRALSKVKCYIDVPEELKDKEAKIIEEASIDKLTVPNRMKVAEVCQYLGWQRVK